MIRLLGFLWTLPNTIIGLVLGLLTFQAPRVERGVLLFDRAPRGISRILQKLGRTAITIGFVVLGTERISGRLLAHERAHVRQYCMLGPFFLPIYGLLYLRYGYDRHPMELAATRRATLFT